MLEETTNKQEQKIALYKIIGAVLGFILVKGIVFSAEDDFLWHMFWGYFFDGRIVWEHIGDVFLSWTFIKLAIGVFLGAVVGNLIATGAMQEFIKNVKEEMEKEEKEDTTDTKK